MKKFKLTPIEVKRNTKSDSEVKVYKICILILGRGTQHSLFDMKFPIVVDIYASKLPSKKSCQNILIF